jgi:hypothetical protein
MREEAPIGHPGIAEEAINPVEELGELLGIERGRRVALGQAIPERVIGLPFGWPPSVSAEDAEVAPVNQPEDQRTDRQRDRRQRPECRPTAEPPK